MASNMHSDKKGYTAIHAVSKSLSSLSNVKAAVASKQTSKTGKKVTEESLGNENSGFADLQDCKLEDFKVLRVLGTGSFGRVSLAKHVATGQVCAIKALSKKHILKNEQIEHLTSERDVLRRMNFPFVIHFLTSFQDEAFIYFVLEYSSGGEFFRHLKARGRLPEENAKFYAAEVLLALEYLHKQDIVYRDLKPENLLLDAKGFIKMTDFGFAKVITNSRTYTLCGTPDYLAPEVILNKVPTTSKRLAQHEVYMSHCATPFFATLYAAQGHSKPVDWWAYGVLLYEMIAGFPPFFDQDITNTYKKIVEGRFMFPSFFPPVARDLVRKLLQVDLSKRYGNLIGGIGDIKAHPWFKNIDWDTCLAKRSLAPIKPIVKAADDASNFDDYSALKPMQDMHELSAAEQLRFAEV